MKRDTIMRIGVAFVVLLMLIVLLAIWGEMRILRDTLTHKPQRETQP